MKLKRFLAIVLLCFCCVGGACNPTEEEKTVYPTDRTAPTLSTPDYGEYTTYYFDSQNGLDTNDGLSEATPLKTASKLNATVASVREDEPVRILIKAGSVYEDTLKIGGFESGDETPLVIAVYGKTGEAQYAKIDGGEKSLNACVEVFASNVRVSGLELTNPNGKMGFQVYTAQAGAMKNVVLADNYIHDVNFRWNQEQPVENYFPEDLKVTDLEIICPNKTYQHETGGIIATAATSKTVGASWLENFYIFDNDIEKVSRSGVFINSQWAQRPGLQWGNNKYCDDLHGYYPHKNVYIKGNDVNYAGGDGIVLIAAWDSVMEYNTCFHANYLGRGGICNAGIWAHSNQNLVMQYNEAAYAHLAHGAGDGQGFDIDIGNSNVIFQYNYAHHNDGGGLLLCNTATDIYFYDENGEFIRNEDGGINKQAVAGDWRDIYIRNNVFVDNGESAAKPAALWIAGPINRFEFTNNTVIASGEFENQHLFYTTQNNVAYKFTSADWLFQNNIFALRKQGTMKIDVSLTKSYTFTNNLFHNFSEESFAGLSVAEALSFDPQIADLATVAAEKGFAAAMKFKPANAAAFTSGKALAYMSEKDFGGNSAKDVFYVGAWAK